jgi:hypothetical protein
VLAQAVQGWMVPALLNEINKTKYSRVNKKETATKRNEPELLRSRLVEHDIAFLAMPLDMFCSNAEWLGEQCTELR